jgi:glycosyltransferase involved in cell wall biosynthesis
MDKASHAPQVSVVIPVFNLESFLEEAVDSVLDQTFRDFEVILVDDGSSDRSREIIRSYQRREPDRVRAVFQKHAGAAAARNAGIALARGKWIAFLDGDDAWKPDKLRIQLGETRLDPRINLLSTAAAIIGEGRLIPEAIPDNANVRMELLRKGCFITLSSALISRGLLQDTRFDEGLPGAQDLDLYLRLADRIRYRFIPEPLIRYRVRANAISDPRGTRFAQLSHHYRIMKREKKKLESADAASYRRHREELRAVMARLAHEAAYYSLESRVASWSSRLGMAWTAIREDPRRWKNYRFLLQALLPRQLNRRLQREK